MKRTPLHLLQGKRGTLCCIPLGIVCMIMHTWMKEMLIHGIGPEVLWRQDFWYYFLNKYSVLLLGGGVIQALLICAKGSKNTKILSLLYLSIWAIGCAYAFIVSIAHVAGKAASVDAATPLKQSWIVMDQLLAVGTIILYLIFIVYLGGLWLRTKSVFFHTLSLLIIVIAFLLGIHQLVWTSALDDFPVSVAFRIFVPSVFKKDFMWLVNRLNASNSSGWKLGEVIDRIRIIAGRGNYLNQNYPEIVLREYVLNPAIRTELPASQSGISDWGQFNHSVLNASNVFSAVECIKSHAFETFEIDIGPFRWGQVDLGPREVFLSRRADQRGLAQWVVASARSFGIPARLIWSPWVAKGDGGAVWVEYWDNNNWIPTSLFPEGHPFEYHPWKEQLPVVFAGRDEDITDAYFVLHRVTIPNFDPSKIYSLSVESSGGLRFIKQELSSSVLLVPAGEFVIQETEMHVQTKLFHFRATLEGSIEWLNAPALLPNDG